MEVYLISNNLLENNLSYADLHDIELKKLTRPLSVAGETLARDISLLQDFNDTTLIYSSLFSSSLASAKYLAERINKKIIIEEMLNDCKTGDLGTKSLSMVRFMQEHDFNIKLNNGESLNEVGQRIETVINKIINLSGNIKTVIFTHHRAILGFLVRHAKTGYSLDDDLVIEYNDKVIYNDIEKDADIIKIIYDEQKNITNIEVIDL